MGMEIERKFIVNSDAYKRGAKGTRFRQGYLSIHRARVVRVRFEGDRPVLTIKGEKVGAAAPEFNYEIPASDAQELLDHICIQPIIEKTRYDVEYGGHIWHVDEFHGANNGLVLAEIELGQEDERFQRPPWLGEEVTEDYRYSNARLTVEPFARFTS